MTSEHRREYDRQRATDPHRQEWKREYNRRYRLDPANRERRREAQRRWKQTDLGKAAAKRATEASGRERFIAYEAVYLAVKRGELQRQPCIVCGAEKVQAHHPRG